jgi:NAD(P)H dehydrogenase (quinone)
MIVITGATGKLATAVAHHLRHLTSGTAVVGAARRTEATDTVFDEVRYADYDDPESLATALRGAETLLLVSGTAFGRRVAQHTAVVRAAQQAGVTHLAYTSAPRVDSTELVFGPEHLDTERVVRTSGIRYTILRNNWYHENYIPTMEAAVATGTFTGNAADGRIASAARDDYAEATARILADPAAHRDSTYELAGDTSWTYRDLASLIGTVARTPITYRDVSTAQRRAQLVAEHRTPSEIAAIAGIDDNIAHGALEVTDSTLSRLLGRPTTPLRHTVEAVVLAAAARAQP